jgi:Protein of unknown function (DUF3082)
VTSHRLFPYVPVACLIFSIHHSQPFLLSNLATRNARTRKFQNNPQWTRLSNQHYRKGSIELFSTSSSKNDDSTNDLPSEQQQKSSTTVGFARAKLDDTAADIIVSNSNAPSEKSDPENSDNNNNKQAAAVAATKTINERLLAELQEAEQKERFGARSAAGKKMGLVDGFGRTRKTDQEIQAAIAEARDLNGVNPIVAILGSFFAFAVAAVLWLSTNKLGAWFATHPPDTDVYFVMRTAQVFRNVVMGLISLASGFFGVTGLGIFLLGVRVAYGVATGELDPTPIPKKSSPGGRKEESSVNMGSMVDLMLNKKPGRRGGGTKKDNDLFGM